MRRALGAVGGHPLERVQRLREAALAGVELRELDPGVAVPGVLGAGGQQIDPLGLIEAMCAATVMGNAVHLFAPPALGELAAALAESLATCDMPGGVVNVLTTDVPGLLHWANHHDDLDAIYMTQQAVSAELRAEIEREAARVMRRLLVVESAQTPATPMQLARLAEVKTVWMSS